MVTINGSEMNWLTAGGLLTSCGMIIVFLVLIILIFAIYLFGKIMTGNKAKKPKAAPQKPAPVLAKKAAPSAAPVSNDLDDEIIAVIAAAVDAMYAGSGKRAVIRNIRPAVSGGRSAWANAGLIQNVKSF